MFTNFKSSSYTDLQNKFFLKCLKFFGEIRQFVQIILNW